MMSGPVHLIATPIILPLAAGALLLMFDDRERRLKATVTMLCAVALLANAVALMRLVQSGDAGETGRVAVYLLGNWPPPFAVSLIVNRLAAMMLLLTASLAIPAVLFALARWHRAGPHFHSLLLFLLMGLNGAFLTGDLFNLFVFFEVMLAASYGLVLHGSGLLRVRAGLHYIAVNLVASLMFLIGVALIYSVSGTLNMADLATHIPRLGQDGRTLLEVGASILAIAFLVKAGMWPLSFWLPAAYTAAAAPVAAIFAIMTKVGVYILLRLSLLFFGPGLESSGGSPILYFGGVATLCFGAIGVLASQALGRIAAYSVWVSSGTLLAAAGLADAGVTAGALYYLASSTLAISAFFMLVELVERGRDQASNVLAVTMEAYGEDGEEYEEEEFDGGVVLPGSIAVLGICFTACGLLLAGLPPLSGFVAKFALITAIFNPGGLGQGGAILASYWWLVALLVLSGLCVLIAMSRAGIGIFWAPVETPMQRVLLIEIVPIVLLLSMTALLTIQAGPAMRFMQAAAEGLHAPTAYIDELLEAQPAGPPARSKP